MVDLHVVARPGARRDLVEVKVHDGVPMVTVHVKAPPDKNKANKAILILLSRELDVPSSFVTLVRGHASRDKILRIEGLDHDGLDARLRRLPSDP